MRATLEPTELDIARYFPYPSYRKQQESLIPDLHKHLALGKNCVLVAPNGFGKTVTTLTALLPLVLEEHPDLKVIYCCRTHVQSARVIEELAAIQAHVAPENPQLAARVLGVSIRGRGDMCLDDRLLEMRASPRERMQACQSLRKNKLCKYYTNLYKRKKQVEEFIDLALAEPVDAQELIGECQKFDYCPYYLIRNFLLKRAKVIVCNYQWIFNPAIRENFLKFIEGDLSRLVLVLDECHNLLSVATEMDSDQVGLFAIQRAINECNDNYAPSDLTRFLRALATVLRTYARKNEPELVVPPRRVISQVQAELGRTHPVDAIALDLLSFGKSVQEEKADLGQAPVSYCNAIGEFWQKWVQTAGKPNYVHLAVTKRSKRGKKLSFLEVYALDPREITKPVFSQVYATLNISGTVIPDHYARLTGMKDFQRPLQVNLVRSPFPPENVAAFIVQGVNTRGPNRTPTMYGRLVRKIAEALPFIPANAGVFCASYGVLKGLVNAGLERAVRRAGKKFFRERRGMSSSENAKILAKFKKTAAKGGALLAGVCGGRNSEGEDFPGDFMNAVFVVGIPYSRPTPREEAKIAYYDQIFNGQGWNYGYLIPAFQRANQAAGRPIRRIQDRGAIILLDDRFIQKMRWLSSWLRSAVEVISPSPGALEHEMRIFFNGRPRKI